MKKKTAKRPAIKNPDSDNVAVGPGRPPMARVRMCVADKERPKGYFIHDYIGVEKAAIYKWAEFQVERFNATNPNAPRELVSVHVKTATRWVKLKAPV